MGSNLVLILGAQGVMGKSSYRGHLKNIYGVSMYMFTCLQRPEADVRLPGAEVLSACELSDIGAELNSVPLEVQEMF